MQFAGTAMPETGSPDPQDQDPDRIREVRDDDLPALTRIYNHYVANTHVTFDIRPFSVGERGAWLAQFDGRRYRCLVAEDPDNVILGYACTTPLKAKPAYATSVEISVYLDPDATGRGIGQALYAALFRAIGNEDLHRAYAGIALPNPASMSLHRRFDFRVLYTMNEVGRKFDRYWDVTWLEKKL